ncbi:exonuclease SbcCD subunit D C-terminal domain-containing protein [Prosthecochloris sp. CIB 2401]|uniref:exonuclease SbcCD subunit D C-terminal domain-containing protein n=1 Tax=Prosthecochloris sp. CIB 2401 TaxID=1868325 RepID=UPI00080A97B7|nr:exonuclease SbcCD subunit D C-terminal domain-containing protein [Prosthecochloris sp. CIB 2401]ANT65263.1 Nuclease SbcCD subunit D [Prosthecochloris sp. CIB 2401]
MKILHTSDWHLGRSLYGRKRYEEFSAFLDWLVQTIEHEKVDALLVAGDVFDTSTPSNRSQELYYRFLCRVAASCCRHVVVVAGNHDSPSFLSAPKELLRTLNVHVVGSVTDVLEDEVIPILDFGLRNADLNTTEDKSNINLQKSAIICAIPYLRDKDVRTIEPGETIDDKNRKLVEGIKAHYAEVVKIAERKREEIIQQSAIQNPQSQIPIVAMGHLFTAGGKTVDGDGVRELYVGSLAHVGKEVFPSSIDYLALGHLHVPQAVGSAEHIRYCGSPIPMGYGEAKQQKSVVIVDFRLGKPEIKLLPIPRFQELICIVGSLEDILAKLEALKQEESAAWLEIEYTGREIIGNLREMLDEVVADSAMEIRRIKNRCIMDRILNRAGEDETLDDLDAGDVFTRCLDACEVPDEDREELTVSYNEIIKDLLEEDRHAE